MRMVVNGKKINIYSAKCTWISNNHDGMYDYTATVRFNSNTALSQYEKQCVREYIEFLIDGKEDAKHEQKRNS